jgi:hypothetical protein
VKNYKLLSIGLTLIGSHLLYCQPHQIIKFAKQQNGFYFFKKGNSGDSIIKNKSDLFYLIVADSMKPGFSLSVENGRLIKTTNDSLVKFEHMPGLKYETLYTLDGPSGDTISAFYKEKKALKRYGLITLINGTSDKEKNIVVCKIDDKKKEGLILENRFLYFEE